MTPDEFSSAVFERRPRLTWILRGTSFTGKLLGHVLGGHREAMASRKASHRVGCFDPEIDGAQ
jgi:hypothetical protein